MRGVVLCFFVSWVFFFPLFMIFNIKTPLFMEDGMESQKER